MARTKFTLPGAGARTPRWIPERRERRVPFRDRLLCAAKVGDMASLERLLRVREDRKVQEKDINLAFCTAAEYDRVKACRLLYDKSSSAVKERYKVDENPTEEGESPLHVAARFGRMPVLRLMKELDFNLNQLDDCGRTPLYYAAHSNSLEAVQFLVEENGADPNCEDSPLECAVREDSNEVARFLLAHGADPNFNRKAAHEEDNQIVINQDFDNKHYRPEHYDRATDFAITQGNAEILLWLLQQGAFVGGNYCTKFKRTSLAELLCHWQESRETKLSICRILVDHAKGSGHGDGANTAEFLQHSLDYTITYCHVETCDILLEAGVVPSCRSLFYAIDRQDEMLCRLLVRHGANPFLQATAATATTTTTRRNNEEQQQPFFSPFHAAARLEKTDILGFFLEHWHEQFASSSGGGGGGGGGGGKNSHGDLPIHVLCRDAQVPLHAISFLVEKQRDDHNSSMVATCSSNNQHGHYFPFHTAVMSEASLNVIFYLLQFWPDALV